MRCRERLQNLFKHPAVESAEDRDANFFTNEEVEKLDKFLNELIRSGEFDLRLTDDIVDIINETTVAEPLNRSMLKRLNETVKKALDQRRCQVEHTITFGNYLKSARLQGRIEPQHLAKQIGVAPSFLSEIENDVASPLRLSVERFLKLCRVLELKGRDLVQLVRESKAGMPEVTYRGVPLTREDRESMLSDRVQAFQAAKESIIAFAGAKEAKEKFLSELEKALREAGVW